MDFDKIIDSGQVFRCKRVSENVVEFITNQTKLIIKNDLSLCKQCGPKIDINNYFDINRDYSKIEQEILVGNDEFLKKSVKIGAGLHLLQQDLWEVLISFIISQRNNIKNIRNAIEKLCKDCGTYYPNGDFYGFPTPEQILTSNAEMKYLGYRKEYIIKISEKVFNNEFDLNKLKELSDEEAYEMLLTVNGIGPKVANCILLFGLNRINAFPIDVWMQRILDRYYNGKWDYEKYAGINGIIQMYMFFAIRQEKPGL